MSRRRRTLRYSPTTVFIACEGRNTEPAYFQGIKELVEEQGNWAITIYPDKTELSPKTDALGLIREAQSRAEEFDELWVVFDKDGYTKHKAAFELAKKLCFGKRVQLAFSSIAFEHWVLLHFERNQHAFAKSSEVIQEKLATGASFFPNYVGSTTKVVEDKDVQVPFGSSERGPFPPRRVGHEVRGRGPDSELGWDFGAFLPPFCADKKEGPRQATSWLINDPDTNLGNSPL
ncbi:MAG: RloB family protein [Bacteroidota bacterium]